LLLSAGRERKWWFLSLGVMVPLGVLLLSRSFWYGAFMGILSQVVVLSRRKRQKQIVGAALGTAAVFLVLSAAFPDMTSLTGFRVFENTIDEVKRAIDVPVDYRSEFQQYLDAKTGLSRPHLSLIQLRASLEAPFWGHGAWEEQSRFAHATIPTAMYDYGLFFTIPLLTLCYLWLKEVIHAVSRVDGGRHELGDAFDLVHLGVAVTTVTAMLFNDFFITTGQYMCLALFIAGLHGSISLDEAKQAAGLHSR